MKIKHRFRNITMGLLAFWLCLFVLFPFLMVFFLSFLERDESNIVRFNLNLQSYGMLFDPMYLKVFFNSFAISITSTFVCLLLGYPFAFLLTKASTRWRNFLLALVIIPFWSNSLVRTYAIKMLIGNNGFINMLLLKFNIISEPLELLYTNFSVILGTVYIYFPFMVLPLYSVIEKLDKHLIEAASDLGASRFHIFAKIVLPLTMPGILAGSLLVFLPSLGCFYASDLLGGSKILVIGNVVKGQFLDARDWPFGSAISISLTLLMGFLLWFHYKSHKQFQKMAKRGVL